MASDRLGVPAARSRHQVVSGAAGAPEKKGLDLYGRIVADGAHRGHCVLLSTSCRRPDAPDVRSAQPVSVSYCEEPGPAAGVRRWTARLPPRSVVAGGRRAVHLRTPAAGPGDRKSTRLNSSHQIISYAVFCLKKKNKHRTPAFHRDV